jgi:hypothetical protein
MNTNCDPTELEIRAAEALKALLRQVSAVKVRDMKHEPQARSRAADIVVHIDVYGHSHTLACEVNRDMRPSRVRASLRKLHDCASDLGDATPVFIAPHLSPEVEALCKESSAGFLDFEGNGRLNLGEVFIGKRSLQQHPPAA